MSTSWSDFTEIRRFARLLLPADAVVEMRAIHAPNSGTVSGYFDSDHRRALANACDEWSGQAEGVYATINPVNPDLLARASNREKTWCDIRPAILT